MLAVPIAHYILYSENVDYVLSGALMTTIKATNSTTIPKCISVTIIDDSLLENPDEFLQIGLSFNLSLSSTEVIDGLTVVVDNITVTIEDNDGEQR